MDPRKPSNESPLDPAEDLLARFREGDAAAFDGLVGAFQDRLVQFFHRLCWDLARSEDLTQQVFLKLLRGSAAYQPQGRLATYVFRVATNVWIDHYRSSRPGKRMFSLDQAMSKGFDPEDRSARPSPAMQVEVDEEKARMRGAIERLTEPHRLVFELAIYQELPYAQVGEILDIPVGTVKSRMHNSVRALKEFLAERDAEGGERVDAESPFRGRAGGGAG